MCLCGVGWQKPAVTLEAQPEISGWKCQIMTCVALISPCHISNLAVYHEWSFSCRGTALPIYSSFIHRSIYICISASIWSHYTYKFLFIAQFVHLTLTCPRLSHYHSTAAALYVFHQHVISLQRCKNFIAEDCITESGCVRTKWKQSSAHLVWCTLESLLLPAPQQRPRRWSFVEPRLRLQFRCDFLWEADVCVPNFKEIWKP